MRKAYSPYKETVINYVSKHPGCCKYDVARHCTYAQLRNPSKQYYIVNTAIRNGWIKATYSGGKYKLYVEADFPISKL